MGRRWAIVVLLSVSVFSACRAPVRDYGCPIEGGDDAWRCNLRIVERAVRGKKVSVREFEGAHAFFRDRTSIDLSHRRTAQGLLPGPDLQQDLRRLREWAEQHSED